MHRRQFVSLISAVVTICLVLGVWAVMAQGQKAKSPPVLTDDQNRAIDQMMGVVAWATKQVDRKRIELESAEAQLREAQMAGGEFVKKLQVEGYDLDLGKRAYVPKKKK